MEGPGLEVLARLPAGRQVGLRLELRILCCQPAEAVVDIIVIDTANAHFLRVERRRLDRESHAEDRLIGRPRRLDKGRQRGRTCQLKSAAASNSGRQQSLAHGEPSVHAFRGFSLSPAISMPGARRLRPQSLATAGASGKTGPAVRIRAASRAALIGYMLSA